MATIRLHNALLFRQIRRSGRQAVIFLLCVSLSIVTLVAVNGLAGSVKRSVLKDARALHASDVMVRSSYPISDATLGAVAELRRAGTVAGAARVHEFYSMVRNPLEDASLLCQVKVVERGYPFYGSVALASGEPFNTVLKPGTVIVERTLFDRLGLGLAESLQIGDARLKIEDVVLKEPDRPVSLFGLGPRIFVHNQDLDKLNLVKPGSRVRHRLLLKVSAPENLPTVYNRLKERASPDERVDTFETARSRIKRFFDNFLFFLTLIGILTLLLAGIGIQSTLSAVMKEKEKTIAIMKTLGAGSRFITLQFTGLVFVLGLTGTMAGLLFGYGLQWLLPLLFKELLPPGVTPDFTWAIVLESLLLGLAVVCLFCFLPINRLKDVKPMAIFRRETRTGARNPAYYLMAAGAGVFFAGVIFWRLEEIRTGLYFVGGIMALIAVSALATRMVLYGLRRLPLRSLVFRQASRGLFRPGNLTGSIIVTLTCALAVLFTIYLVERNLNDAFVRSYPPDAPNLFFIDIQPDQLDEFKATLDLQASYYPIVRARIVSLNGTPIDRTRESRRRGDNLGRPFNLTYRDVLLEDERILQGDGLFDAAHPDIQVSVLDTVTEIHPMEIGDRIAFNVQGLPLEATITSIRTREKETMKPYFYFVFRREILEDAPQSIFTAVRVPEHEVAELQSRIAARFPNVSALDVSAAITVFSGVMARLSGVVRFFGLFSMLAGILIIISSVFATRLARMQEAVYFKILGAGRNFVRRVFALENLLLGFISATLAFGLAQAGSWLICARLLNISYRWYPEAGMLLLAANTLLVVLVGMASSRSILRKKPVVFLREQAHE